VGFEARAYAVSLSAS